MLNENKIKEAHRIRLRHPLTFVGMMTYALCFGKPICRSVCMGVRCCLVDILVGVGFFLGGRAAAAIVNNLNDCDIPESPHTPHNHKQMSERDTQKPKQRSTQRCVSPYNDCQKET